MKLLSINANCNPHIFPAPIGVSYGQPASSDKICGPVELKPGFFLSNEPGYYKEGDFGVRLENILETVEAGKSVGSLIKIVYSKIGEIPDKNVCSFRKLRKLF